MNLVLTYEEYNKINNDFVNFIDELVNNELKGYNKDFVKQRLLDFQNAFETVKLNSDKLIIEENEKENLNDLKYLVVDALFIALDLVHFYNCEEVERFKMRAVNYINKRRKAEMFK